MLQRILWLQRKVLKSGNKLLQPTRLACNTLLHYFIYLWQLLYSRADNEFGRTVTIFPSTSRPKTLRYNKITAKQMLHYALAVLATCHCGS